MLYVVCQALVYCVLVLVGRSVVLLTLGAHAPEGYGSCPVCVSVCLSVCLSETLIWGLGLVEV